MWVYADVGLELEMIRNFCFGPKIVPKAPFEVKMDPSDAENH